LFKVEQLVEILEYAVDNDSYGNNKYNDLIRLIPESILTFFPNFKLNNKGLLAKAIAHSYSKNGVPSLTHLIPMYKILNTDLELTLKKEFNEVLNSNFNDHLYESLLWDKVIAVNENSYFEQYIDQVNRTKGRGYIGKEIQPFEDFVFYNFALRVYYLRMDFGDNQLKKINYSSQFENWILNPGTFDYSQFDIEWIKAVRSKFILTRLKDFSVIGDIIEQHLKKNYDSELAEIYIKYFKWS
jgi:hypothetical protein